MTLDLDAIEQRANAATPGPWTTGWPRGQCANPRHSVPHPGRDGDDPCVSALAGYLAGDCVSQLKPIGVPFHEVRYVVDIGDGGDISVADAAFIAAARQDVPALVAEVRRLRALGDEMAAALEHAAECYTEDAQSSRYLTKRVEAWREQRGDAPHG